MEIAELFNKFINIYEENQISNWITILSTVLPIIISIIVLWQNHIISKRNEIILDIMSTTYIKTQRKLNKWRVIRKYTSCYLLC